MQKWQYIYYTTFLYLLWNQMSEKNFSCFEYCPNTKWPHGQSRWFKGPEKKKELLI